MGYIAYFELNVDYIIETYCINKEAPKLECNGKCHLVTQLASGTSNNSTSDSYLASLFEAFVPVYFQPYHLNSINSNSSELIPHNWRYLHAINTVFKDCTVPPPKV
ncbi:hypothetical protein Q4566_05790 [Tamlana sp. 2_MG-2023]|uniref:hypothetical protein n=1 Tax=unclassified Tamlana TaxID=2614803 RepID=UPI0026E45F78|nr:MULTISPECIES: hypothetical protein [unclassified Tamlana]MDO6759705.1 hypothetical protein [Tamlana sp. 2_MG-2023]MDO6791328.1 hypothetical protein [Tamlana sp. 1_MG-2023]